jgi:hypothetical protein
MVIRTWFLQSLIKNMFSLSDDSEAYLNYGSLSQYQNIRDALRRSFPTHDVASIWAIFQIAISV